MPRRLAVALIALTTAVATLPAQTPEAIAPVLDAWWARTSHRTPGTWGVVVADQNGHVLWQVNQD